MSPGRPAPNVELSEYVAVLRRRSGSVVLGLLLGVTLSALAIALLPKTYESTASVLVNSIEGQSGSVEGGRTTSSLNLDTEAQIVKSSVVSRLAADKLGTSTPAVDLAQKVSVSVPANTAVLEITFSARSSGAAERGATAFADAYLENRKEIAGDSATQGSSELAARTAELNDELRGITEQLQTLPEGSAERTFAETRRQLVTNQLDALSQQTANAAVEANPGRVITDAVEPSGPAEPNVPILAVGGVLLGVLLGVVLAFVADRRDRTTRDRQDLDRIGLDVLAPELAVPPAGVIASPLDVRYRADAMRMLRNSLLAQLPDHRGSVLIAGASAGAIGSTVALNLATTLARGGLNVVLAVADSDMTNQTQADSTRSGLAEVLQGRVELEQVIKPMDAVPGLEVVYPGRDGSLYSELLQSESARQLMLMLRRRADILVVDVSPMSVNADAQSLATHFDGVVLVAERRQTTTDDLLHAIDQLRHVSARVMGGIVAHTVKQQVAPSPVKASKRQTQTVR